MKPIRLIAIGSPFGVDHLAWPMLDRLRAIVPAESLDSFEWVKADRPGPQLLDLMEHARTVILIDVLLDATQHGALIQLDWTALQGRQAILSSHALGVYETLRLGHALHRLPEQLIVIGLCLDPKITAPEQIAGLPAHWAECMARQLHTYIYKSHSESKHAPLAG